MAGRNDFLLWGTGLNANVLSQAQYQARLDRDSGATAGRASAQQANKTWRQASIISRMITQFIIDRLGNVDAIDDGTIAALEANFTAAVRSTFSIPNTGVTPGTYGPTMSLAVQADGRITGLSNASLPVSPGRLLMPPRVFTVTNTYVPTAGTATIIVDAQGGGGGGSGAAWPTAGTVSLGAPGSGGTFARAWFAASTIGASQPVFIGAGGASAVGGVGGPGGATILGSPALLTAPGGLAGGMLINQTPPVVNGNGSTSAAATGSSILFQRRSAVTTLAFAMGLAPTSMSSGMGGASQYGEGSSGVAGNNTPPDAVNFGAGGAGVTIEAGYGGHAIGGAGRGGIVIIYEFS